GRPAPGLESGFAAAPGQFPPGLGFAAPPGRLAPALGFAAAPGRPAAGLGFAAAAGWPAAGLGFAAAAGWLAAGLGFAAAPGRLLPRFGFGFVAASRLASGCGGPLGGTSLCVAEGRGAVSPAPGVSSAVGARNPVLFAAGRNHRPDSPA